jgi:hypothetical protein
MIGRLIFFCCHVSVQIHSSPSRFPLLPFHSRFLPCSRLFALRHTCDHEPFRVPPTLRCTGLIVARQPDYGTQRYQHDLRNLRTHRYYHGGSTRRTLPSCVRRPTPPSGRARHSCNRQGLLRGRVSRNFRAAEPGPAISAKSSDANAAYPDLFDSKDEEEGRRGLDEKDRAKVANPPYWRMGCLDEPGRTSRLTVIVHAATYPNLDPVPDDVFEEVRGRSGDDAVCALWFGRCRVHGEV